jgi:tRNA threonylcarbamoyl adenosine modification protein YeaZ
MNILCFDTCGLKGCVTLVKNNEIVGNIVLSKVFGHNETLLPAVNLLLSEQQTEVKDMDIVGYVRGPGSFTGLRIGAAVAYGLSVANNIKLKGLSSLFLLNKTMEEKNSNYNLSLIDARKKQVYLGCFKNGKQLVPYTAISPNEIKMYLEKYNITDFSFAISGTGAQKYKNQLQETFTNANFIETSSCFSKQLAMEILNPSNNEDFMEEPLYIRKSDAELNRNKKNK